MERNFSVDDIVGTLWNNGGDIGVQSNEKGNGGEDEYNLKGLNRSASEWAFQEFIKHNCQRPSRNDLLTYFSSHSKEENDEDGAKNDAAPSEEIGSKLSPQSGGEPKCDDAAPIGSTAPKMDHQQGSSPSKPEEAAKKSSFQEPEIKVALNPLFSGLHSEMAPTCAGCDPQEINTYYQEKLAEACLRARIAREGVLGLPGSAADHPVGHLQANEATAHQFGPEGASAGTACSVLYKPVTSGSSQDESDNEEIDNGQNFKPGDKKRVKRMLSNRESARRSRRRKQAHLNELESQVAQLRVQNSTLAESLHSVSQKLKDASKDNLQLKTYVEMLKAKLLAATTLHRQMTMANSNVHMRPPHGTQELPALSSSYGWESGLHSMQPPRSSPYPMHPPMPTAPSLAQMNSQHLDTEQQSISLTVQQGMKMNRTPSMQRVGSMDHLQKKIRNAGESRSPR